MLSTVDDGLEPLLAGCQTNRDNWKLLAEKNELKHKELYETKTLDEIDQSNGRDDQSAEAERSDDQKTKEDIVSHDIGDGHSRNGDEVNETNTNGNNHIVDCQNESNVNIDRSKGARHDQNKSLKLNCNNRVSNMDNSNCLSVDCVTNTSEHKGRDTSAAGADQMMSQDTNYRSTPKNTEKNHAKKDGELIIMLSARRCNMTTKFTKIIYTVHTIILMTHILCSFLLSQDRFSISLNTVYY